MYLAKNSNGITNIFFNSSIFILRTFRSNPFDHPQQTMSVLCSLFSGFIKINIEDFKNNFVAPNICAWLFFINYFNIFIILIHIFSCLYFIHIIYVYYVSCA